MAGQLAQRFDNKMTIGTKKEECKFAKNCQNDECRFHHTCTKDGRSPYYHMIKGLLDDKGSKKEEKKSGKQKMTKKEGFEF
jgi:hypothetical protein